MCPSQSYLEFTIEEQCYALPLTAVKKVIRAVELTRLPDSPPILKGLLNMRGEIIPVLNIRSRFGLVERDILLEDRIIICKTAERVIAFVVDLVRGVVEVAPEKFDAAERILPEMEPYISGVAKIDKETVLLYDLDKLFSVDDIRSVDRLDENLGLDHRFGHLPPGVETPGYYQPSLQDGKSPIGATDNSPAIYCRVAGTRIKAKI